MKHMQKLNKGDPGIFHQVFLLLIYLHHLGSFLSNHFILNLIISIT